MITCALPDNKYIIIPDRKAALRCGISAHREVRIAAIAGKIAVGLYGTCVTMKKRPEINSGRYVQKFLLS